MNLFSIALKKFVPIFEAVTEFHPSLMFLCSCGAYLSEIPILRAAHTHRRTPPQGMTILFGIALKQLVTPMFETDSKFDPILMFLCNCGAYLSGTPYVIHSLGSPNLNV